MLGWEYPPRFAGGLGKASQGIAHGLAALGTEVLFVLPNFRPRRAAPRLRVTGAREWLLQGTSHSSFWDPRGHGHVGFHSVPVKLSPYGRPGREAGVIERRVAAAGSGAQDRSAALYGSDLGREVARFASHVSEVAERAQVDLVHAHDWMTFPAARAAAVARSLPLFLHVHSTEYDRSGEAVNAAIADIERGAFSRATHIFAVSHYTQNVLIARYGVPAGKITVVYNAPDDDSRALDATLEVPGRARPDWIVFLGRLTYQKGPDHFLHAASLVAQINRNARFLVCGSGDMLPELRALAGNLGITDRVEFRGFLQPAAVDRLLSQAGLLVMPSVSEPFGLVALEALRCGTPVILSKQSGVREVLGHSLQVDFWDHEKLADQMLAVLRLPVLAAQLVEEGREQLGRLSWEESAQRIRTAYTRATGIPTANPLPE